MPVKNTKLKNLPGDLPEADYLARVIRVNHAGEFGAQQIYRGQLAILGKKPIAPMLQHMAEQEEVHLEYFAGQLQQRRIRPTALHPLWQIFGFGLGAATALLGEKAAMACTVAVEEVIDGHYEAQLQTLPDSEKTLKTAIKKFQAEELEHRDIGLAHDAEQAPAYRLLYHGIKTICRGAIWASERL